MSQRPPLGHNQARVTRRHDRHGGYDLTDIYEARLLAQGVTANEFVARRSAADLEVLPLVKPLLIGRGSPGWGVKPAPPETSDQREEEISNADNASDNEK